jgi:hypothetical protein
VTIRLERDGYPPLLLTRENGWAVRRLDLGYPSPRLVVDDRPQANGTDDRTQYFGDRVVSLDLLATGPRQAKVDELGPFLVPNARSYLYFPVGGFERRVLLRARARTAQYRLPERTEVLVQWDAPNGTIETATVQQRTAFAVPETEPGVTFDVDFDIDFPQSSPIGSTSVVTVGNAFCPPVVDLYGPVTNPSIENLTDGFRRLVFAATIADGQFFRVDFRERTVLLNGDPVRNRYNQLDFARSQWWTLQPGTNLVRYTADTFASPARAVIRYRCQWV